MKTGIIVSNVVLGNKPMILMKETWILLVICLTDLIVTLGLLASGRWFFEGNPIMGYYLEIGVWAFVAAKIGLIVMPLFIAEYSKRFKPVFVKTMLRFAIFTYVATYLVLFAGVNAKPLTQEFAGPRSVPEPLETPDAAVR